MRETQDPQRESDQYYITINSNQERALLFKTSPFWCAIMPFKKKTKGSAATPKAKDKSGQAYEPWVDIQQRAFTNWVNVTLKDSGHQITDLFRDLEDGVVLIKLLETLSHKKMFGK